MARSKLKICHPANVDRETVLPTLAKWLREQGCEVNDERNGYRVLMYRKDNTTWTQLHTGLTANSRVERNGLRVSGPEASILKPVEFGFYRDGEFGKGIA